MQKMMLVLGKCDANGDVYNDAAAGNNTDADNDASNDMFLMQGMIP